MESQKDIAALKYSLNIKLELFNMIRSGYDVSNENDVKIESKNDIKKEIKNDIVNEIKNQTEKDETTRKSSVTPNKFGTSYFGRRRR